MAESMVSFATPYHVVEQDRGRAEAKAVQAFRVRCHKLGRVVRSEAKPGGWTVLVTAYRTH